MKLSGAGTKPKLMPLVAQPQPPISAKIRMSGAQRNPVRWSWTLLWFMRLLAALWMFLGVLLWMGILQVTPFRSILLDQMPLGDASMIVFFAVINLVAAVGLWLAAPWGGVLWLVAALALVAQSILHPLNFKDEAMTDGFYVLLILIYFCLSFLAARERDISAE